MVRTQLLCEYVERGGVGVETVCKGEAAHGCDECGKVLCRYDLPRHLLQEHTTQLRRVTPDGQQHMTSHGRQAPTVTNYPTVAMIDKGGR